MHDNYNSDRTQVWRAGAIPYNITASGDVEMMFMIPATTEYNRDQLELKLPQIAKGRIERFEQPDRAALRECAEELGLVEENIASTIDGGIVLGRTYMFAFRVHDKNRFTAFSSETESVMWMTYDEFMTRGRELHKPVVEMMHNMIIEQYFETVA